VKSTFSQILKQKIMQIFFSWVIIIFFIFAGLSCSCEKTAVTWNFDKIPDRIWAGEDFWTVPLEDWQVKNGRIECNSLIQNATFSVLPYILTDKEAPFQISFDMGLTGKGVSDGSAGLMIGVEAPEEKDVRAAVYFGEGIKAGVNTEGYAFLQQQIIQLPKNFDLSKFRIEVIGKTTSEGFLLQMNVLNANGNLLAELSAKPERSIKGIVQLVNNFRNVKSKNNGPRFWYDNLMLEGKKFENHPENRFGPVLWTMFTLSRNTLKLTAQLPPVGETENREVELQLKDGSNYQTVATGTINPDARCVTYKLDNWDASISKEYRVIYHYNDVFGKPQLAEYAGTIRKEPLDRPLRMGALTCQYHYGFPYSPLVKNLSLSKPDILYFSGDQIYEGNGGYPIKRTPEDTAILSYLGKYYMFGWAFGDLMRDVPTVCTPDDHDIFQGNLWGGSGIPKTPGNMNTDDLTGFAQSVKMVNAVNRTQCAHLPDPFDPTPIEQGMSVWYTDMIYGRVSFAIVSDRIFKTGPDSVATWDGRKDHLKAPLKDPSSIEIPGLEFLGKRQENFLNNWVLDWRGADMKVLLSQTLFANVATHHGQYDAYLFGDMDSGGWPKTGRDRAIRIIRKGFAFQVAGDQHVPSIVQYGIDQYRDAGWCYVTPAITVGYSRWFRPDELKIPVQNRPSHGLPNTGEYQDAFGNLNYVYAIGNPGNFEMVENRYQLAQEKTSGFGMVIFDCELRNITMESWHFLADVANPADKNQHPGWPFTISQFDNYGREAVAWLPNLKINGEPNPVVEVVNTKIGEIEYMVRIKGNEFSPKVFSNDTFTIRVGYPEKDIWKTIENLKSADKQHAGELAISF
jgi:alkaline phosphatase D